MTTFATEYGDPCIDCAVRLNAEQGLKDYRCKDCKYLCPECNSRLKTIGWSAFGTDRVCENDNCEHFQKTGRRYLREN